MYCKNLRVKSGREPAQGCHKAALHCSLPLAHRRHERPEWASWNNLEQAIDCFVLSMDKGLQILLVCGEYQTLDFLLIFSFLCLD